MEQSDRARFLLKNRAGPKSGPKGPKRPKNGVFVVLLDNGSEDLLDFLCVVQSISGLLISRAPMLKIKSGWPEIGPGGPERPKNGIFVVLLDNGFEN